MLDLSNIRSLSDFQRNTREHIENLKKTGHPLVLTVNGQAEVVVQSAAAYQKLLDAADELDTIMHLRRALDEMADGKGVPAEQFFDELRRHRTQAGAAK